MKNIIKKVLKEDIEDSDDFSWVDTELELIEDQKHRFNIISNTITETKSYKGWNIHQDRFDGIIYWNIVEGYTGMATPEWDVEFEIPIDISHNNDYDGVTVIRTPKFKYVIEVINWYSTEYFEIVYNILTDYIDGVDVDGLIETE